MYAQHKNQVNDIQRKLRNDFDCYIYISHRIPCPYIDLNHFFFGIYMCSMISIFHLWSTRESYAFFAIYQCFLFCCWLVVPNGLSHHLAKLKQNKCLFTHRICKYITSSSLQFSEECVQFLFLWCVNFLLFSCCFFFSFCLGAICIFYSHWSMATVTLSYFNGIHVKLCAWTI